MKLQSRKKKTLLKIAILVPIVFLLFYHTSKLYSIYFGNDFVTSNELLNSFTSDSPISTILTTQSILRLIIIICLLLVVLKKKLGIIGMWLGIGSLILSQFYIASESTNELIQSAYSGLKPLKGLILPIVITYLYKKINHKNQ
jgi:hypothetical protein